MRCVKCRNEDISVIYLGRPLCEKHWIIECQESEEKRREVKHE